MANLVAYIPVPNRQYIDWLARQPAGSKLFLVEQKLAEMLLPRLSRNIIALSASMVAWMLRSVFNEQKLCIYSFFEPDGHGPLVLSESGTWVLPHEDLSKLIAEKYILSAGCSVQYEDVWGRYDMTAVLKEQPVLADVEMGRDQADQLKMQIARDLKQKSPDWFRQIGAVAFRGEQKIACAYNTHLPNEYEAYVYGDPAINRDAGQNTKISLALHAEQAIIASCARKGIRLEGASLYVTTFPCPDCARVIARSGISRVFFEEGYSLQNAQGILASENVQIVRLKSPEST